MTGTPYQKHSETSKAAAEKLTTKHTLRQKIRGILAHHNRFGRTADELSLRLETPQSTIGARLREMELEGMVIKTTMKRKTRYKRDAFVYVHPDFHIENVHGRAAVKTMSKQDRLQRIVNNIFHQSEKIIEQGMEGHDTYLKWKPTAEDYQELRELAETYTEAIN